MAITTPAFEEPRQRRVARHRIRERIQEMLLSGSHRPGVKLVQEDLADQLGVARSVVREALLELKASGLVDTIDNRGMFMAKLNPKKIAEAYDVREVLEGLVARECCERITRAQIRELKEMSERIHQLALEKRFDEMGSLDRELHLRLMRIADNGMLVRLVENYRWVSKIVRVPVDNPEETRDIHMGVLEAIEQNRPEEAERRMRHGIRRGKKSVLRYLETNPSELSWVE